MEFDTKAAASHALFKLYSYMHESEDERHTCSRRPGGDGRRECDRLLRNYASAHALSDSIVNYRQFATSV